MKPFGVPFLAFSIVLMSPKIVMACGGCTDAVLLMTLPWAGAGILLLWLWILAMLAARWHRRRRGSNSAASLVRGSTLAVFAMLGSFGYVCLAFLTMGSLLLPSLCIGLVWAAYLAVRLAMDVYRSVCKEEPGLRTRWMIHGAFLTIAIALIAYYQMKANTVEHCIRCLGYGHHHELYAKIMPRIVADGPKAVGPLIRATSEAITDWDKFRRMNAVKNATFCLACIGGPEVEEFLAELVKKHAYPSDYYDLKWYEGACFAYARSAGPRAADDLATRFDGMPHAETRDDRAFLLVALAVTRGKRGVAFTLDHMELLLKQMEGGGNGSRIRVVQATAECLVFGTDPNALARIPVYRDWVLGGAVWLAEPRPNDYTSEFFWTESSENGLRPAREIVAAWKQHSASIRKRWADSL